MKQIVILIAAICVVIAVSITPLVAVSIEPSVTEENICDHIDVHWLRLHAAVPSCEIISKRQTGDLCEVILDVNGNYVPLYTGKDFFIAGQMYQNNMDLTNQTITGIRKEKFVKNKESLDKAVVIEYTPPEKKELAVYMFTDPLCPYCNTAGEKIQGIADKYGATVKMLFFNVHGDDGKEKSVEAICRNFTLEQYIASEWKKQATNKKYDCKQGEDIYERSMTTAKNMGITGVPQFFLQDGTNINGADMAALENALKNTSNKNAITTIKR